VKIVIDHISGSRRGQRQELDPDRMAADARIRFGRHPECEVSFDAHRDIDASSRHAEMRRTGDSWVLVDVGSSNGTFVDGRRITELAVVAGTPLTIEFGPAGPKLRLFLGDEEQVQQLGAPPVEKPPARRTWVLALVAGLVLAVAAAAVALAV
jgi:hypothetical protein